MAARTLKHNDRISTIMYNLLEANDLSQYDQMEPSHFYSDSEIKCSPPIIFLDIIQISNYK